MDLLQVALGKDSYYIYLGYDSLDRLGATLAVYPVNEKVLVVTNPTVRSLYGERIVTGLQEAGFAVAVVEIPEGETYKCLSMAEKIYTAAVAHAVNRKSTILALGGGVIGDLAGFAAATFMRGTNFVQVPTTLLAQVDSSVGGKVAVNHVAGKNLIGCFYQPLFVFSDMMTLKTLPKREWQTGLAEVVKYGVIWDGDFFDYLAEKQQEIAAFQLEVIHYMIHKSCSIKAQVVEQDEREEDLRAILNYGHTVGHGIENVTNYAVYTHGEAVAMGMVSAALLSCALKHLSPTAVEKLKDLLTKIGLEIQLPKLDLEQLIAVLYHDKKVLADKLRFVLPTEIGQVIISEEVSESLLHSVLQEQMRG